MNQEANINQAEPSVLKTLRALMPSRILSYHEALQRAELQASRLLSLHHVSRPGVPIEIVAELPRVRVERSFDLPVSGSAHWEAGQWVIRLNASESNTRQRFSLLHEFKHVIDHPVRHLIRGDERFTLNSHAMAERVADYFAACVLMPKTWVKNAFAAGLQSTEALAELFEVSPSAMSYRLSQLGITERVARCRSFTPRTTTRRERPNPFYFRSLPTTTGALR